MTENVSILIVNSSHESIDIVIAILKAKISSEQRPFIACLSYDDFRDEIKNETFELFIHKFIAEKLDRSRKALKKLKDKNEFNQLEAWLRDKNGKKRTSKGGMRKSEALKSQLCTLKRDETQEIILDFPNDDENEIELFLILFDVYDCNAVKSIALIQQGNGAALMGIVNLYPRYFKPCSAAAVHHDVKCEQFWQNLIDIKFREMSFSNIAFLDMDVPVESSYILNIRSQLIFDQFSHFVYDFENIKNRHRHYRECLNVHEVNGEMTADVRELKQLEKHLNEIPLCMLSVERIWQTLVEQISSPNDTNNADSRRQSSLSKQSRKSFEIAAFGKTFHDMTDKWRRGYDENPKMYSDKIVELEMQLHDIIWCSFETISVERRQILNYFMKSIADNLCGEASQHLEFYMYILEFMRWQHFIPSKTNLDVEKEFYENRSVGHESETKKSSCKTHLSDMHVDYKNVSRIPIEIEQLTDDRQSLKGIAVGGDYFIQFYSKASMLQRLLDLMNDDKNFQRKHFQLFDVTLLKFQPSKAPKIFNTKCSRNILPTPLCFRDYNDYVSTRQQSMDSLEKNSVFDGQEDGDKKRTLNEFKPEDFLLETSLKRKLLQSDEKIRKSADSTFEMKDVVEKVDDHFPSPSIIDVYNVTNNFTEFIVTESEFNSYHLHVKAQLFNWLNCEEHLNLSCSLHDTHLTFSHDLRGEKFKIATLQDENSRMICSIDMSENQHKRIFTFPHGMRMKICDDIKSIEFDWMENSEHVDDERRRIFFTNGFVLIYMNNGINRVYSPTGTIYEISQAKSSARLKSSTALNQELTRLHHFSITSIHFLATFINISAYSMMLSSGSCFHIENDSIVDEVKSTLEVRELLTNDCEGEKLYVTREDGLRILKTSSCMKCLYSDTTLITTTYDHEHLFQATAEPMDEKPISILDEIWLSEAEKTSQIVLDNVVETIGSDYFLCMNRKFQFEHRFYGRIRSDNDDRFCELEMYNGMRIEMKNNCCILISMKNGVELRVDETQLLFYDAKCCECHSSNKLSINIDDNIDTASNSSFDDINNKIACASDIDGNTLEIKHQSKCTPEVLFHKAWKYKSECRECLNAKREFNMRHFGERWLVVNRDMTGYEVLPQKLPTDALSIETNDTILYSSRDAYEVDIDDRDLHIDMNDGKKDEESTRKTSRTQVESTSKRKSQQSQVSGGKNNKKKMKNNENAGKRRKSKKASKDEALVIEKALLFPWVTPDDPSITPDISLEQRQLIEFYVNPLQELPESIDISLMLKLKRDCFMHVKNGISEVKKYSNEKFIINVRGLMACPLYKKSFDENFELIVQKSIEGYIAEKLEHYRCKMARVIVEDLLASAFKIVEEAAAFGETKTSKLDVDETQEKKILASDAVPVIVKSFSFV